LNPYSEIKEKPLNKKYQRVILSIFLSMRCKKKWNENAGRNYHQSLIHNAFTKSDNGVLIFNYVVLSF